MNYDDFMAAVERETARIAAADGFGAMVARVEAEETAKRAAQQAPGARVGAAVPMAEHPMVAQLRRAGMAYDNAGRADRGQVCADMAAKLARYGRFASEKQEAFARNLVEWSTERKPAAAPAAAGQASTGRARTSPNTTGPLPSTAPARIGGIAVPRLHGVMLRHADFRVRGAHGFGEVKLSRKNGDSLCWIVADGAAVGKIEQGVAALFARRLGERSGPLSALLLELEADPLEAAKRYGRASGVCCSCGRDLTDPASIAAGIGPICAEKFT